MDKKVLVVDDSPMMRRIVGQILKEFGFTVIFAENGRQGLEQTSNQHPDLVIMDIEMPEMDGIEATFRIKGNEDTAAIPVLFFTSLSREEDIKSAEEAGGAGFLNKPVCKDELKQAIDTIFTAP